MQKYYFFEKKFFALFEIIIYLKNLCFFEKKIF